MNLLLDTHTYIWFSSNSRELSPRVRELIEDSRNTAYISMGSLWEISIKVSIGKPRISAPLEELLLEITENGIEILPISFDHILRSSQLPFHHRDPFDRLLVAQALSEQMQLLSADTIFDYYTDSRVW